MKKLSSLLMILVLLIVASASTFAESIQLDSMKTVSYDYADKLTKELNKIDCTDSYKVNKLLESFYKKNNSHQVNKQSFSSINLLSNYNDVQGQETYILDDGTEAIFENVNGLGIVTIISDVNNSSQFDRVSLKQAPSIMLSGGTIYRSTGSKEFKTYALLGNTLFTITVEYQFRAQDGNITVLDSAGFIKPGFLSAWTGSIWTNTKDATAPSKAYVKSYGTASWSVPLSELIGMPVNIQAINYKAYVYCDEKGTVTSKIITD